MSGCPFTKISLFVGGMIFVSLLSRRFSAAASSRSASSSTSLRSTAPGVNADGTLKFFPEPIPTNPTCVAACEGDLTALSSLPMQSLLVADESGNTPLVWSADRGQKDALVFILEAVEREQPASVNTRGYLGNTALSRAARGGHLDCVMALLSRSSQINPNIANDKLQYPLHFAAYKRHLSVVEALLASPRCDSMVTDRKGRTPAEDTKDEAIRSLILQSRRR